MLRKFTQVNDGKKFDHIKTYTLTGTFKIFIAAGVDPRISPTKITHFGGTKITFIQLNQGMAESWAKSHVVMY